jgi:hypothetical protein
LKERIDVSTPDLNWASGEIAELAGNNNPDRVALALLAAELRNGGGQRLAGVDLLSAYPPAILLPDKPRRRHGIAEVVSVVRDLLIFAPVGITWFVLRKAVSAWNSSGSNESLLKYWQSHPKSVVPISQSALYVVAALVAVGVLTIVVAILDRRGGEELVTERKRLGNALAVATFFLSTPSSSTSVSGKELARMADKIYVSTEMLGRTLTRIAASLNTGPTGGLADALDRWNASAASLTKLGASMVAPAKMIEEFIKFRKAVEQDEARLRSALDTLIKQLEDAALHTAEEAIAHGQVADNVRDATRQLATALDTFTDRTEFLERLIYQVRQLLTLLEMDGNALGASRDNA